MSDILKTVLSLSVSGTLLFTVLLVLKNYIKLKVSQQWQYYIWLIVVLRLILPVSFEKNIVGSLFNLMDNGSGYTAVYDENKSGNMPNMDVNLPYAAQETQVMASDNNYTTGGLSISLENCLFLIWIAVALTLMVRKTTVYQSFIRYIKAGLTPVSDIELLNKTAEIAESLGVKVPVELCTNNLISSPMLIGFIKPCIVLPTTEISESDFRNTILHELTHYKRADMFYKWLVQLVLCLHWFNPFVYLIEREINRACELSCDEAVIARLGEQYQRSYGDTLLNAMVMCGNYNQPLASLTLNESKELLKERLGAIMAFQNKSKATIAMTAFLSMVMIFGAGFTGAYAATTTKAVEIETIVEDIEEDEEETVRGSWINYDGSKAYFMFTQQTFYQEPYLIGIGWNLTETKFNSYQNKAIVNLAFYDVTVTFSDACKKYIDDEAVLSSITEILQNIITDSEFYGNPLERPIITSIKKLSREEIEDFAEESYAGKDIAQYASVQPELDSDLRLQHLERAFKDKEIAFFSVALENVDKSLVDLNAYAERAYNDNEIAFFSVLMSYLSKETKMNYLERSWKDKKIAFYSVLSNQ